MWRSDCSLSIVSSFDFGKSAAKMTPYRGNLLPHEFYQSIYKELIAALCNGAKHCSNAAPSMCVLFTCVTYHCLCFNVIMLAPTRVCFSITSTYLSSCYFMDLKSTALLEGVKTLFNKICLSNFTKQIITLCINHRSSS